MQTGAWTEDQSVFKMFHVCFPVGVCPWDVTQARKPWQFLMLYYREELCNKEYLKWMWRHRHHRTSAHLVLSGEPSFHCDCGLTACLLFTHSCSSLLYADICVLLPWKHEDFDSRSPCVARHQPEWVSLQTGLLSESEQLFQKNPWGPFWLFVFPQVKLSGATAEARTSTVETLLRPAMVQTRPVPASLLLRDPVSDSLCFAFQ